MAATSRRSLDERATTRRVVTDDTGGQAGGTHATTGGQYATVENGDPQSAGLVADTGEDETQGEDDAGRTTSSQDLEAATQRPSVGDGKSLADVNLQEDVGEVRGKGDSGVEAVGDERRVADEGDATKATDGPQSEDEETETGGAAHDGGNEGHRMIDMGGLENESDRPTLSS